MTATVNNTHFFIGTTKPCVSSADYASDVWTEVLNLQELGEIGDQAEEIKVNLIDQARTKKFAGSRDAGDFTLTILRNNVEPGQMAMNAAFQTATPVNFKITLTDGSTEYFAGPILEARTKYGTANNMVSRMYKIAVSGVPVDA